MEVCLSLLLYRSRDTLSVVSTPTLLQIGKFLNFLFCVSTVLPQFEWKMINRNQFTPHTACLIIMTWILSPSVTKSKFTALTNSTILQALFLVLMYVYCYMVYAKWFDFSSTHIHWICLLLQGCSDYSWAEHYQKGIRDWIQNRKSSKFNSWQYFHSTS